MDENLVLYAIQDTRRSRFEDRYQVFSSKETRDEEFKFLTTGHDEESNRVIRGFLNKVEMAVRVETEQ